MDANIKDAIRTDDIRFIDLLLVSSNAQINGQMKRTGAAVKPAGFGFETQGLAFDALDDIRRTEGLHFIHARRDPVRDTRAMRIEMLDGWNTTLEEVGVDGRLEQTVDSPRKFISRGCLLNGRGTSRYDKKDDNECDE